MQNQLLKAHKAEERQRAKKVHSTRLLSGRIVASLAPLQAKLSSILKNEELLSPLVKKQALSAVKEIERINQEAKSKLTEASPEPYEDSFVSAWPSLMVTWKSVLQAAESIVADQGA